MQQKILKRLRELEKQENIRILFAVESGSRAWGFASPDSDYDVRFIYIRPQREYLRLDSLRDVIELPIDEQLDMNGWDMQKALRLLYKSNPTLFEWISSPIVYLESDTAQKLRTIMPDYFSVQRSLYHYISMAENNYREYLKGDMVRAKKYFYVLRPLLACRWILEHKMPPPMLFSELLESQLPNELYEVTQQLLNLKMHAPEVREIPRIDKLNQYIDAETERIRLVLSEMERPKQMKWEKLNQLFWQEVKAEDD